MSIRWAAIMMILAAVFTRGDVYEPFAPGLSMATLGTIIDDTEMTGRQAWIPAAFLRDSLSIGFCAAGIIYYDAMDNMRASSIRRVVVGGWKRSGRFRGKAAYSLLDALGIYYRQEAVFSLSREFASWINASVQIRAHQEGLWFPEDRNRRIAVGASAWIPMRSTAFSLSIDEVPLYGVREENRAREPVTTAGVHTIRGRFGAQGVVIEARGIDDLSLRIAVGQEYRPWPALAVTAALAVNPLMISLGLVAEISPWGVYAATVYHPLLGWSKGAGLDWAGGRRSLQ